MSHKMIVQQSFTKREFSFKELCDAVNEFAKEYGVNPETVQFDIWNDWYDHTTADIQIDMILKYDQKK